MMLSLDKCVFGMEEGKFLGYVVTAEGTRADLKKVKVITHRSTPEGLKQESRTLGIIKICAYDKNFSSISTYTTMMLLRVRNHHGGKLKILKIQAGVQVSRLGELRRHLQLWKCFGRLYYVVIILVRNIGRKGTSRDKEETRQATNASHSKGRQNPNALPVTKEQNNQLCTVDRKKQDADPNSLFKCDLPWTSGGILQAMEALIAPLSVLTESSVGGGQELWSDKSQDKVAE
ncbi:hypothetical protein Tco_1057655 [Tanacetum coccineum]|uniref:Uncharacterized protein n=1 Tax=Tanacetum coccineum TaxID=301880 RepID=A0ABQ5H611_9ASTR